MGCRICASILESRMTYNASRCRFSHQYMGASPSDIDDYSDRHDCISVRFVGAIAALTEQRAGILSGSKTARAVGEAATQIHAVYGA